MKRSIWFDRNYIDATRLGVLPEHHAQRQWREDKKKEKRREYQARLRLQGVGVRLNGEGCRGQAER